MKNIIVNIIGPSACGKTTLAKLLRYPIIRTTTTRTPREFETENDYDFTNKEEFVKNKYIMKTEICGNYYGVNKYYFEDLHNKSKVVTIVTDLEGTKYLKEKYKKEVISVLVIACKDEINSRLLEREEGRKKYDKDYNYSEASRYADMIVLNNTKEDLCVNKNLILERINKIENNSILF